MATRLTELSDEALRSIVLLHTESPLQIAVSDGVGTPFVVDDMSNLAGCLDRFLRARPQPCLIFAHGPEHASRLSKLHSKELVQWRTVDTMSLFELLLPRGTDLALEALCKSFGVQLGGDGPWDKLAALRSLMAQTVSRQPVFDCNTGFLLRNFASDNSAIHGGGRLHSYPIVAAVEPPPRAAVEPPRAAVEPPRVVVRQRAPRAVVLVPPPDEGAWCTLQNSRKIDTEIVVHAEPNCFHIKKRQTIFLPGRVRPYWRKCASCFLV